MLDAKYVWNVKANGIVSDSEIYKVILANRGIDDGEKFFSMGEESLHDPYLIEGMERAVSRVIKAISANEKILIYGDYDCDGISAITVMVRALSRLNANVGYDLPDRFQDGYGLNMKAVDKIIKNKVNLVITVDNGITCVEEVAALKAAGIDTIITDHHEGKEVLPDAYQILHAKLSSNYPFREIAGVMIAYKFASAIANDKLTDLYDLVMIGTIADLMPLEDENQAMVNLGLKQLKHTKIPGLRKLVEFSHLDIINETAIAFKIAPKINSSGRMGRALQAVRLLVTDSEREVNELILQIEENHASRKDLTESAVKLCELLVDPQDEVLVIASKDLHEGVIGICAQKLAEKYQKTTVVITIDEAGVGKGSARAFGDENILEMLENNRDLLIRFGGHQQAAGLQIAEPDIEKLRKNMNLVSNRQEAPILQVDMQVRINEVRIETVKKLQDLSFFTATFLFAELEIVKKQLLNNKHVKLTVASEGKTFDVLAFNNTEYYYSLEIGDLIDVVGGMNLNTWKSRISLQVIVKDLASKSLQVLDLRFDEKWKEHLGRIRQQEIVLFNDEYFLDHDKLESSSTYVLVPKRLRVSLVDLLSKELLGKCYRILEDAKEIEMHLFAHEAAVDVRQAMLIVKIFTELGFATFTTDRLIFLKPNGRRELTESDTYVTRLRQAKLIDRIYTEKNQSLPALARNLMEA